MNEWNELNGIDVKQFAGLLFGQTKIENENQTAATTFVDSQQTQTQSKQEDYIFIGELHQIIQMKSTNLIKWLLFSLSNTWHLFGYVCVCARAVHWKPIWIANVCGIEQCAVQTQSRTEHSCTWFTNINHRDYSIILATYSCMRMIFWINYPDAEADIDDEEGGKNPFADYQYSTVLYLCGSTYIIGACKDSINWFM